jgi:hypothetical protein
MGVTIHAWLNHYVMMYMLLKDFGRKRLLVEWVQFFFTHMLIVSWGMDGEEFGILFYKKMLNLSNYQETADIHCFD